jgi:hypothetical protein
VVRCPICEKNQLAYFQSPRTTSCYYCGARWIQSGEEQAGIIARGSPGVAVPMQLQATAKESR